MTQEEYCPKCEDDVQVKGPWGDVKCPVCGLTGYWEEEWDGIDCWASIEWKPFKKKDKKNETK